MYRSSSLLVRSIARNLMRSIETKAPLNVASRSNSLVSRSIFNKTSVLTRNFASEAGSKLSSVLLSEIGEEKKINDEKMNKPNAIPGFNVESDGAEVKLTKTQGDAKITITFNVNGTVEPISVEEGEIESTPPFTIEIEKSGQKIAFNCDFMSEYEEDQNTPPSDSFNVVEVSIYSGEFNDKIYTVSGSILDGVLYDHLIGYLAEYGIDNEFADKLCDFSTTYEHSLYLGFLKKMNDFVSK